MVRGGGGPEGCGGDEAWGCPKAEGGAGEDPGGGAQGNGGWGGGGGGAAAGTPGVPPTSHTVCPGPAAMAEKRPPRMAAPMAAEDGLLLLQSQALAEEEAAKTKGEMLTRFLKVRGGRGGAGSGFPQRLPSP